MRLITPIKEFTFRYDTVGCKTPLIPVRFEHNDGRSTSLISAILDSGSDCIVIRKDLANWLGIALTPVTNPVFTAGGERPSFSGIVKKFILGRGGREVIWEDVEIRVIEDNPAFLIGITPVWEEYIVHIDAHNKKFALEPRH